MKTTVNFSNFVDAFRDAGRVDQFTYEAKHALFDWLEEFEADTGEEIELDVIALCCEYTEYNNIAEFGVDYDGDYKTIEDIENQTPVIKIDDDAFIIQQF